MTDRIPSSHAEHDPLLVAAFTAGDLGGADHERAELLAARCPDCALLAADLRAIATATAALPPAVRPRDFSLRAEDAARLRRRGWRGLVRAFAGPRSGALKPLATGLTTIGLAGLLLAAMPTIQIGGSAAAPGAGAPAAAASGDLPKSVDTLGAPSASAGPGTEDYAAQSQRPAAVPVTRPAASPLGFDRGAADASAVPGLAPSAEPQIPAPVAQAAPAAPVASPLVVLSGTFLIVGLGLFGLHWMARRLDA